MSSTPEAGGVALKATLDYGPAIAALASFRAEVEKIEGAGANISKLQEGMARTGAQMKETLSGMQAVAEELDVIIKKTNDLSTAQARESEVASEASRAQALAMRSAIKDSEYLNKTLDQRQQVLSRISAALKGQSIQSLTKPQADVLNARYGQLAVTEYSGGALAASSQAQAQKVALAEAAAEQDAYYKALEAMDARDTAMRIANIKEYQASLARGTKEAYALQAAAQKEALAETARYYASLEALDAEANAASTRNARAYNASLARGQKEVAELQKAALAEVAAAEAAAAAIELEVMREQAAEQVQMQASKAAAAKLAAAQQVEAARAVQAAEAARAAENAKSAAYETSTISAKMRMLKSIEQAENASLARGTGGLSQNPLLAAKFPTAALSDYAMIGAGSDAFHKFRAELEAVGKGAASAATGIKATAQEAREVVTIAKDIGTGEWGRFTSSFVRLLTLSGTFDGILGVMGMSIGAAAAALGIFGVAALRGAQEQNALNLALAETGNLAGTTTTGLEETAEAAAHMGGTIGQTKEVVEQLAASGRYTAGQIREIANAASSIQGAGGNVEAFVRQIDSLKNSPTEAVYKLNEQYHFLSATTFEAIAAAERHGDAVKASALAIDEFSSTMSERTQEVIKNQGAIIEGWHAVKSAVSEAIDAMLAIGRTQGTAQQLAKVQAQIKGAEATEGGPFAAGPGDAGYVDVSALKQKEALLQENLRLEQKDAETQGIQAEKTRLQVQAQKLLDEQRKKIATPADKRKNEEELLRKGLQPLVELGPENGGISQKDVDDLVAKSNAKYHDRKKPMGRIDPTDYNAAEEQAKLDAAALKTAQDRLSILKSLGLAISEAKYANIEDLQITAEKSSYEASRQKILKEIRNAERYGNEGSKQQLRESLVGLERQHQAKLTQIQLDYEEQKVARDTQAALLNINTVLSARSAILRDLQSLYGTTNDYDQNALDNAAELAATQKAQYDQAVQYQQLKQAGASQEELALARQANVLSLASQIYAIEQDRQKLLMDNATTLANVYQQTLNAVEQQIQAIEKGRNTLADQVVGGLSSGTIKANESLFSSFKSPQTADKYTLRDYTANIGGSLYDSITSQLAKSMAESQLKGIQDLLKALGATSNADAAREQAQKDLAVNTQTMTQALSVDIPALLKQMLGLMDGTITPSGPVGNAALNGGASTAQGSATAGSGASYGSADGGGMTRQLDAASSSMKSFAQTGTDAFNVLGMNATQFTSLFYTGVVAATTGGKQAFKNFAAYAIAQLLELYAIQQLVGMASRAFNAYSANASAAGTSTPADLISGYTGHADGTSYIDAKGYVTAPGGSRDDTALVRLSHGEAVLNADAVKRVGRRRIDEVNQGASRFADGGVVGSSPYSGGSSGGGMTVQINVDASSKGGSQTDTQKAAQSGQLTKELEAAVLQVFSKYSQPGGVVYSTIKQLTH